MKINSAPSTSWITPFTTSFKAVASVPKVVLDVFEGGPVRFAPISQLKPDGAATPADYEGGSNCGPTSVAMVLRAMGVAGLPTSNTALVTALAEQLGTTSNGTAASNLAAVFAQYGLQTEQLARGAGNFGRGFLALSTARQTEELGKLLGPDEAARLMAQVKAQKITLDSVRVLGLRAQTEGFVAQHVDLGHPVLLNVSFSVLHPEAASGTGHFVVVTGVQRGTDGRVSSYAILDPWSGQAARVSADQMDRAIVGNSTCLPTAVF